MYSIIEYHCPPWGFTMRPLITRLYNNSTGARYWLNIKIYKIPWGSSITEIATNSLFVTGAFLLPFFLMLIFIGLPIFYLELYIGQYTGLGPLKAFSAISPFFSGLGYCTLVVISIISIYYMIIVAWTLFYTIVSIGGNLGWGSCDNDYNTDCKFSNWIFY